MDATNRDLKQKHDIEQMAVIGKIYNMQWLKSNSQFSGHVKVFPDGNELVCTPATNKTSQGSKTCTNVASAEDAANYSQLENDDRVINNQRVDNNNIVTNNNTLEPTLKVVEESIMETTWHKNVNIASSLLPNSQQVKKMNMQENIVHVPLERLKLVEEEEIKSNESYDESSNKCRDTIHSMPVSTKADKDQSNQINAKQCHDNNNNNAKSKAQTEPELQKGMQKSTTKITINKTNDHKVKRHPGNSIKESCTKQVFKDQDDSLVRKNEKISNTDSRKISLPVSKYDKCNKVNGYNRPLITGKGTQVKDQQFYTHNFSKYNDSGDKRKSTEGLDEKNRSQRRNNETDEPRKSHKVQLNRSQSYNVQYNRNKPLAKSQQQYLRDTTKEEENSINRSSGFNDNATSANSAENGSKKKCELTIKCNTNERAMGKPSGSVPCRRSYQNVSYAKISSDKTWKDDQGYQNSSHAKTSSDKTWKDDQGYAQKFKKDSHIYRRSSGTFQSFSKDTIGKEKPDEHKKVVPDSSSKDYRASQSEGSRITVCPLKAANGATNNKTDSFDSTVHNQQSARSLNACSNGTKGSATTSASVHMSQESSHLLQVAPCNRTEVQFAKTEQDHTSNNNSGKTSSEAKSVKFSDSIQEMNTATRSTSSLHTNNAIQQHKIATGSYYYDLQSTPSVSNAQQLESEQSVQTKSYLDNGGAQSGTQGGAQMANQSSVQNPERNMYVMDMAHQKSDQSGNCGIAMGNNMSYHNVSPVYLNQYSGTVHNTPRKTTDSSIVSHSGLMPSTSSYTMENPSIMQGEPSNIYMHSTQTSVLPASSGYQNHPVASQHNQWNLSLPDMLLYGNAINSAHSLNMQLQNSRHVCNTDYNGMQQGYMQCPLYYVPQLCMQGWNPIMQYTTPPLYQNATYTNCSAFPSQVLPSSTTADSINCSVATSMQNNPYKQFQHVQQLESNSNFSVPVKLDNSYNSYNGSMQACKSNVKIKDNCAGDVRARSNQYRVPLANDYQGCAQDGQATVPYSYGVSMDPARNASTNMHLLSQKYAPRATANYQRMPEHCSSFQSNLELGNRKDDARNDSECTPPMVSPKECMYYGMNYSRNIDAYQNSTLYTDNKSTTYMAGVNPQSYAPQYHKNGNYHVSPKELASRASFVRGIRKTMEQ